MPKEKCYIVSQEKFLFLFGIPLTLDVKNDKTFPKGMSIIVFYRKLFPYPNE